MGCFVQGNCDGRWVCDGRNVMNGNIDMVIREVDAWYYATSNTIFFRRQFRVDDVLYFYLSQRSFSVVGMTTRLFEKLSQN